MPSRVIKTDADFDALGRLLFALERPFTVEWRKGADRSHAQNRLMWEWAGQFAAALGDRTAGEVQREWKLTIGVPILRAENDAFRLFYDKALKPLTYPEKLAAMEYVPVTSQMTVPQMRAFMDAIQRQGAEQGVTLTDPESRLGVDKSAGRYFPQNADSATKNSGSEGATNATPSLTINRLSEETI